MDCAICKHSTEGCACIKCSMCASQFHLECLGSEHLVPTTNNWRCCRCCELIKAAATPAKIETDVRA